MQAFGTWLASTPLGSALRTAIAVMLSLAVADWTVSGLSLNNWVVWVTGAVLSFVPALITWLNPQDTRWGRGKP